MEMFYLRLVTLEAKKDVWSTACLLVSTHGALPAHSGFPWEDLNRVSKKKNQRLKLCEK
jgi:hypothetical protein